MTDYGIPANTNTTNICTNYSGCSLNSGDEPEDISSFCDEKSSSLSFILSDSSDGEEPFDLDSSLDCSGERSIDFLHTSWDIGISVQENCIGQPVISRVAKNCLLAKLNLVHEGDILCQINGQDVEGISELGLSALLRALPRGLVRLKISKPPSSSHTTPTMTPAQPTQTTVTCINGLRKQVNAGLATAEDSLSGVTAANREMASSFDSYHRQVNYRSSSPCESSIRIEPMVRTELSHAKTVRVGEPAEFFLKIRREDSEDPHRTKFGRQQHTSTLQHSERAPQPMTFQLMPSEEAKMENRRYSSSVSIQEKRKYFASTTQNSESRKSFEREHSVPSVRGDTSSPPGLTNYKVSENFRKSREKFLLAAESEATQQTSGHQGNLVKKDICLTNPVAERASCFENLGDKSINASPYVNSRYSTQKNIAVSAAYNSNNSPSFSNTASSSERSFQYQRHRSFSSTSSNSSQSEKSNSVTIPIQYEVPVNAPKNQQPKLIQSEEKKQNGQTILSDHSKSGNGTVFKALNLYKSMTDTSDEVTPIVPSYQRRNSSTSTSVAAKAGIFEAKALQSRTPEPSPYLRSGRNSSSSSSRYNSMGDIRSDSSLRLAPQSLKPFSSALSSPKEDQPENRFVAEKKSANGVASKAKYFEIPVSEPNNISHLKVDKNGLIGSDKSKINSGVSLQHKIEKSHDILLPERANIKTLPENLKADDVTSVESNGDLLHFDEPKAKIKGHFEAKQHQPIHNQQVELSTAHFDTELNLLPSSEHFFKKPTIEIPSTEKSIPQEVELKATEPKSVLGNYSNLQSEAQSHLNDFRNVSAAVETEKHEDMGVSAKVTSEAVKAISVDTSEVRPDSRSSSRRTKTPTKMEGDAVGSAEEDQELMAMGKRLAAVGATANQEQKVILVTIKRPEGISGGGIGVVLTGGADYENNQIKVNKVITHSLAHKDGRIQEGDRVLLINGQPCSNMTHRQALDVLKAPRELVTLVVVREDTSDE